MKENVVYRTAFPVFDDESVRKILVDMESTLRSGVLTNGLHTKEFERKFAAYIQTNYAVAVNSGTSNLEIALRYFGVKNSEVIVPTNTFIATANSVLFAGGSRFLLICRKTHYVSTHLTLNAEFRQKLLELS